MNISFQISLTKTEFLGYNSDNIINLCLNTKESGSLNEVGKIEAHRAARLFAQLAETI